MLLGIAISIFTFVRGAFSGTVTPVPLGPPRNLRWVETMGNPGYVDFSWDPPISWGAQGPATSLTRYQHEFRVEGTSGNLNPWSGIISGSSGRTSRVHWAAAHQHPPNQLQFRLRARDNAGNVSAWVTSPILTEDAVNPTGGRFAGRFGGRFG